MGLSDSVYEGEWSTVSLTTTPLGLTAQEQYDRFKVEAISEMVLRLAGGLMVSASTMLWLILPVNGQTGQLVSHSLLTALFTATGLIVYAYGTRGFRRQLSLSAKRGTLSLTKININDQGRVVRTIDLDDIESMFLRRPASRVEHASLYIRAKGVKTPLLALTGDRAELELIHQDLCEIIQGSEARIQAPSREAGMRFSRHFQTAKV